MDQDERFAATRHPPCAAGRQTFRVVIITIITFISIFFVSLQRINARLAQLVEHDLPKVGVAGSSLVSRSGRKWK